MVRIRTQYNQKKAVRAKKNDNDCDSSSGGVTSSSNEDTEGSLADFIEHDSDELDAAQEDESYEQDEEHEEEEEEEGTDTEQKDPDTEEDPDAAIRALYTPDMEQLGSVITVEGVRRSTRATKGKAPTRYVDEEYADLMLEDLTAEDRAQLAQEFSSDSSEQWNGEEDDMDVEDDGDEEEDA
jgi:hypothetical protein